MAEKLAAANGVGGKDEAASNGKPQANGESKDGKARDDKTAARHFPEGAEQYGCWFLPAVGSGIWVRTGRRTLGFATRAAARAESWKIGLSSHHPEWWDDASSRNWQLFGNPFDSCLWLS